MTDNRHPDIENNIPNPIAASRAMGRALGERLTLSQGVAGLELAVLVVARNPGVPQTVVDELLETIHAMKLAHTALALHDAARLADSLGVVGTVEVVAGAIARYASNPAMAALSKGIEGDPLAALGVAAKAARHHVAVLAAQCGSSSYTSAGIH